MFTDTARPRALHTQPGPQGPASALRPPAPAPLARGSDSDPGLTLHRLFGRLLLSACIAALLPATSAFATEATALPMQRVVLSTAGVAYFQHAGTLDGARSVDLRFTAAQINDVLKSLVAHDSAGSHPPMVAYPSQEPLTRLLASFAIDLSGEPSQRALLGQLRGAVASFALDGGETVSGRILGTEERLVAMGDNAVPSVFVSIAADDGVRALELARIRRFELADATLRSELDKALAALAEGRDSERRTVSVRFDGPGSRQAALGYVIEAPVWKSSYRLLLPAGERSEAPALQAWAIVENGTEHDWDGVELALISGRPLSFVEDLYPPHYIDRPVHRPHAQAQIAPRNYDMGIASERADSAAPQSLERARSLAAAPPAPAPAFAGAMAEPVPKHLSVDELIASANGLASGETVGGSFQYTIANVSIPRQRAAMLPMLATRLEVEPVSIYDPAVLPGHPLRGARLRNDTTMTLPGGPVTVLEGDTYAGDARFDSLPPGGDRLISFAVDLPVQVQRRDPGTETVLAGAKIERGVLMLEQRRTRDTVYAIDNKADSGRTLLVAHPSAPGWELTAPEAYEERTDAQYRFRVDLAAGEQRDFAIRETRRDWEHQRVAQLDVRALLAWSGNTRLPQPVRTALARAAELQRTLADAERAFAEPQAALDAITAEQARIRANLQTLQRGTPLHDRLIAKLDEQESEIEALQKRRQAAQARQLEARKALEDYLAGLTL